MACTFLLAAPWGVWGDELPPQPAQRQSNAGIPGKRSPNLPELISAYPRRYLRPKKCPPDDIAHMAAGIDHQIASFEVNATAATGCLRRSCQIFVEIIPQQ